MGGNSDKLKPEHITTANFTKVTQNVLLPCGADYATLLNYSKMIKQFIKFYTTDETVNLRRTDPDEYMRLETVAKNLKIGPC